ncbi:MAG TPA: hypothetical protein VG458_10280 [Solirubrobacterales bacterium]|nr:hypothetical protein [Solirubrobacterales bacterium]
MGAIYGRIGIRGAVGLMTACLVVLALAQPALAHRLVLAPEAVETTTHEVVADALASVPAL